MTNIEEERAAQIKNGSNPESVERISVLISQCSSLTDADPLFEQLELEANKLNWPFDRDFAAVALQHYSARAASTELRNRMLYFAIERARWCTMCATAGGEGICRAQHIKELEALLN